MSIAALLAVALWQAGGPAPAVSKPPRQTIAARPAAVDSAKSAAAAFDWLWRLTWEESVLRSFSAAVNDPVAANNLGIVVRAFGDTRSQLRLDYLHCYPYGNGSRGVPPDHVIRAGTGLRAICPSWILVEAAPPFDERRNIDAEILPELLPGLRDQRDSLLAELDAASRAAPSDDWVAGERVRFALDEHDTTRALTAATDCHAQPGWCRSLLAYVHYGQRRWALADSEFQTALPLLPAEQRCAWTDLDPLWGNTVTAYATVPCGARRDSLNERIWWLSAPLYSELAVSGNERRVEHYARLVDVALRETDLPAQRWDWSDGGDPIREMLVRYGWPAYSFWYGHTTDGSQFDYLGYRATSKRNIAIRDQGIFTTAEYPVDRVHTVPDWSAVADPWRSNPDDWQVALKPTADTTWSHAIRWWPPEHMAHDPGSLVQLPDEQTGFFRRETEITMAIAADLRHVDFMQADGTSRGGLLILSSGPGKYRIEGEHGVVGATAIVRTLVPADSPAVVSLEFPDTSGGVSGRIRFGITPPSPLSRMHAGEIAISQPVLVRAPDAMGNPETNPSVVLPRMFGSTTFAQLSRVGVYWETYGVNVNDTVHLALRITQHTNPPSIWRRIGLRLGLISAVDNSIEEQWTEPEPAGMHAVTVIPGPHTIQAHNVTIDLSPLTPGEYTLEVLVARPGGTQVAASRKLTLVAQ